MKLLTCSSKKLVRIADTQPLLFSKTDLVITAVLGTLTATTINRI
ncbi:hypothetical protein QWZ13_06370 [Reinekea marina]|nr:hypothetical protein [Reinekea marina]MDN3648533.1 hypothetical protein [Reinekea marina]